MKVIEGHLTATDKKVVKVMLDSKLTAGKNGKTSYFLTPLTANTYKVDKWIMDRGLIPVPGSALRLSKYVSKIEI